MAQCNDTGTDIFCRYDNIQRFAEKMKQYASDMQQTALLSTPTAYSGDDT